MNAADLDDLAERMVWPATRLVTAVHKSRPIETHAVLEPLTVLELRALAVVLASLVPDDHALSVLSVWARNPPPVSERRAADNLALLEAELAADFRDRRAVREQARRRP